jgi:hypothetical protein
MVGRKLVCDMREEHQMKLTSDKIKTVKCEIICDLQYEKWKKIQIQVQKRRDQM